MDPELAVGFVCCLGFADEDPKLVRGKSEILDLIQSLQSAEELLDPGKWAIVDIDEALQEGRLAAIAPDRGQKRAAAARRRRNLVTPASYHVWSHAETPEDQHSRRPRRGS